jgi:hypothetical protein
MVNIRIRVPRFLQKIWNILGDWSNVTIYQRGKIEIRRIDVILAIMGIGIAIYYLLVYSWQMAILGTGMYIMMVMMALWIF